MIQKKVAERLLRAVPKFQQILDNAKARDVNESDTVTIVKDMLSEVFGYDKFLELTGELAIRGTNCDIAVKIDGKIEFLIEVKAVGIELKEMQVRQAIDYGANHGISWVILTNGVQWQLYRIRFEKPIDKDLVCSLDFLSLDPKVEACQEHLYLYCKEGLPKTVREEYYERSQCLNRFMIGALLTTDEVVGMLRKEIRKAASGFWAAEADIRNILQTEVIKRDVLEGPEADRAAQRLRRQRAKAAKKTPEEAAPCGEPENPPAVEPIAAASTPAPATP